MQSAKEMEKIILNQTMGKNVNPHNYVLSATKKYVMNLEEEIPKQMSILQAVQTMGLEAINDWWRWLESNGFSKDQPNPTNSFVEKFYGKSPLWKTELSQGLVMRNEDDDDYYIVMECSRENEGFKYTQLVLTLGGCM
ncbi:hypothetical protein ACSHWF_09205 [Aerococcus urinaeequi]|uniref:hypothetical protein n=1 Tax=Aerococcus urinaeequi TaxID=51665 RepID=UPI003EDB308E